MCWGKFVPGEEESQRVGRRTTVLHQHSSKKKKRNGNSTVSGISSIDTDSVDITTAGVRAFLFLVILLQFAPQPGLNLFLLLLTAIRFLGSIRRAAVLSIFTTSRRWITRVRQFHLLGGWLLALSFCLETSCRNKALMSSVAYIEYLLYQGCVWASPATNTRPGGAGQGRQEFTDGEKRMASGFKDLEAELWSRMPDEMLEKIFARLPLKNVMQICLLSRSWAQKVSSQVFQMEVCRYSVNSRSLCPLYYSHSSLNMQGYDPSVMEWLDTVSLSYLPEYIRKDCVLNKFHPIAHNDTNRSFQSVAGSLLCFLHVDVEPSSNLVIHMTNPLNRSLRKLPPVVRVRPLKLHSIKVFPVGFDSYRVVVLELDTMQAERVSSDSERYPIRVHMYDSSIGSWSGKRQFMSLPNKWRCSSIEYFKGSIYLLYQNSQHGEQQKQPNRDDNHNGIVERVSENVLSLGVYIFESERWKEVTLPVRYPYTFSNTSLCVCGSSLLMVAIEEIVLPCIEFDGRTVSMGSSIRKNSIRIFKLEPNTLQFKEISRGPSEDIEKEHLSGKFYHDEESIFFSALGNTTVVAYNVCHQTWLTQAMLGNERSKYNSYYGFLQHAYQPRLNPFITA